MKIKNWKDRAPRLFVSSAAAANCYFLLDSILFIFITETTWTKLGPIRVMLCTLPYAVTTTYMIHSNRSFAWKYTLLSIWQQISSHHSLHQNAVLLCFHVCAMSRWTTGMFPVRNRSSEWRKPSLQLIGSIEIPCFNWMSNVVHLLFEIIRQ